MKKRRVRPQSTRDACVTIPMMGRAESLNAASSAAILMWEMMRGRIDMQLGESV
ncbi:MAG: hypothetical protein ACLRRA_00820 [Acutalibacteraceae bacterium]